MMQPAALWLGMLLAIPLALHWLTRSRPRRRRWAAWRFLPPPQPAESRRRRFDEPGLLALRCAALLALVLAAAAPTCDRVVAADPAVADIAAPRIVVDLSASMGVGTEGERPLDRVATRLDAWWHRYHWAEGEVWGCRGRERVELHTAAAAPPHRFAAALEPAWHWGGAELTSCVGAATPSRDLIVFSDREAYAAPGWQAFRSARWVGVGDPAVANAGFGAVQVESSDRRHVRITGQVLGAQPGARVHLRWATPERPTVEVPVTQGTFAVELLKPRSLGRLHLALVPGDMAPWDDVVPLWLPASDRPEVRLRGAFPPALAQHMRDLFYAAGERIHMVAAIESPPTPGVRHAWVLYDPDRLPGEQQAAILADVEAGGVAVVFAAPSQSGSASPWVPGWLHPAQGTQLGHVRVGDVLQRRWPDLADADWGAVYVRRVLPLAEPSPHTEVWLETAEGLPVLTRLDVGQGAVYTWNAPIDAAITNLPYTAVWVPLWLAILDILAADAGVAEVVAAGVGVEGEAAASARVGSVLSGGAPGRWLGWFEARDARGLRVLRSTRVSPDEATVAAAPQIAMLLGGAIAGATPGVTAESTAAWWLGAAALLWLAQSLWAERRRGLVLLVLAAFGGTPLPAAAQGEVGALTAWVPSESAPLPGAVEGVRWLAAAWRNRASPEVSPAVREFAWRTTDPGEPWVWWLGCKSFDPVGDPVLAQRAADLVKRHGTLWLDICGGPLEAARAAERVGAWATAQGWGDHWRRLERDHVLWRTFYLLDGWDDPDGATAVWGLDYEGAERILLFSNVGNNAARDAVGGWVHPMHRDQREALVRQTTNLLLYLTTYDYKTDSIHLPFILERRRRHR